MKMVEAAKFRAKSGFEQFRNRNKTVPCNPSVLKCVHQSETPEDLLLVVKAWGELPGYRRGIFLGLMA